MSDKLVYPELSPELKGGFNFKMLKFFGAGAIIASVTIGSGETFFASRGGAIFGYALLWCFIGSAIMKGVQVYTSARYMTLTGEHPMSHWKYLPGPRGWVPAAFAIISIGCFPFWLAGLPLFIGKTINWIFGIEGTDEHLLMMGRVWGTICVFIAVTLTALQTYGLLERVQTILVGFLLASMLAACFASRPDWLEALSGLVPNLPDYDPWVKQKYPDVAAVPSWVEIGLYLGAIGGGTYDYIGYIGCFREKKWGLIGSRKTVVNDKCEKCGYELSGSRDAGQNLCPECGATMPVTPHETEAIATSAETLPIEPSDENIRRGRAWLWPAKIDVGVGFLCVLIFTICFVVLGAQILRPKEVIPSGNELLTHQADFLTQFGKGWLYLYQLGIFAAFFGTIYGAYEIYIRTAYECVMPLSKKARAMPERKFRYIVLAYCAVGGLTLLWTMESPVDLVKPAAIIGGVFTCGLWCFAMIWADKKFLPKALRMGPVLLTLNVIAGTVLTVLGVQAIIDYVKGLFS